MSLGVPFSVPAPSGLRRALPRTAHSYLHDATKPARMTAAELLRGLLAFAPTDRWGGRK